MSDIRLPQQTNTLILVKPIQVNSDEGHVNFCLLHRGISLSISELLGKLADFADPPILPNPKCYHLGNT